MAAIALSKGPSAFVTYLTGGLPTTAGIIPLDQYLSASAANGGNAAATTLIGPLRWLHDGSGPTMNSLIGGTAIDLALKGQGSPGTFSRIWDFMLRNRTQVGKIAVKVTHVVNGAPTVKAGTVDALYGLNAKPAEAIKKMVRDKFFGVDCIGFVSNYLIWVGYWTQYLGLEIDQWKDRFTNRITKIDDIRPLTLMIWRGSHITIINAVWQTTATTAVVEVCQSSAGGPQTNSFVTLTLTNQKSAIGTPLFKVEGGVPAMPVQGYVYLINDPKLVLESYTDALARMFGF